MKLNVAAPVVIRVPPTDVLPPIFTTPLTETSSLNIAAPATVTVPSIKAFVIDILPPIEAVSPVRFDPSPKYAEAHTLSCTERLPDTPRLPLICAALVAILIAVLVPSP